MEGFTYNGIHCSTYNVCYVPDAEDKWFSDPEFDTVKKDVTWKDGGYFYGTYAKIRTFQLKCFFEEIDIATREKIRRWLGRNTSGKLVFDDKPFVYFNVRPSDIVPGKIYLDTNESYSGTFTIKFMAEDPFGYLTRKANERNETDNASDYCGIIFRGSMPPAPTTSSTSFDVYNAGTESCGLHLKLSGSCSNPIRFLNERNNTRCVLNSLPSSSLFLDINGDTGNIITYISSPSVGAENGFVYHDYGFIKLDPCEEVKSTDLVCGGKNKYDPSANKALVESGKSYVFSVYAKVTTSSSTSISYDYNGESGAIINARLTAGDRITIVFTSESDQYASFYFDSDMYENPQVEEGTSPTEYAPYGGNSGSYWVQLNDVAVSDTMINGKAIWYFGSIKHETKIIDINKENNAIICNSVVSPADGQLWIRGNNHIVIQEKNTQGGWVTPTSLSFSHISIDYNPRLL